MRSKCIVVFNEFVNQIFQMNLSDNKKLVQTFAFNGSDPAFGKGVHVGGTGSDFNSSEIQVFKILFEFGLKMNIAVVNQNSFTFGLFENRIECFYTLHETLLGDLVGDTSNVNFSWKEISFSN